MSIVGTAAASSLSRAVAAVRRADEKRLTGIRMGIRKAIDAHHREWERALSGDNDISHRAYIQWWSIQDKLVNALDIIEQSIQQHWQRERRSCGDPIDELMAAANEPMLAHLAERYLEHRAKANERDLRYRDRKALPAPERAAELANDPPAGRACEGDEMTPAPTAHES
jgi:type II secretory pathway pseudopilin PulG